MLRGFQDVTDPDMMIKDVRGFGQKANSIPEWWIAEELHDMNLEFLYQVDNLGGRKHPGGIVTDFVVKAGLTTAIEYLGAYWHTYRKAKDEALKWSYLLRKYDRLLLLTDTAISGLIEGADTIVVKTRKDVAKALRDYLI